MCRPRRSSRSCQNLVTCAVLSSSGWGVQAAALKKILNDAALCCEVHGVLVSWSRHLWRRRSGFWGVISLTVWVPSYCARWG